MSNIAAAALPRLSGEASYLVLARYLSADLTKTVVEIAPGAQSLVASLFSQGWQGLLFESDTHFHGLLLKSLEGFAEAVRIEATSPLATQSFLEDLSEAPGLLILHNRPGVSSFLASLDLQRFRPALIVSGDNEPLPERHTKYDLLVNARYQFAGTAGAFSVWSSRPLLHAPFLANTIDLGEQTLVGQGVAAFDAFEGGNSNVSHRERFVSGWCFIQPDAEPVSRVVLRITEHETGKVRYAPAYRYPRLDVVSHFGQPSLLMSGFRAPLSLEMRSAKGFSLRVLQVDEKGLYTSDTELTLARGMEPFEQTARADLATRFLSGSGIEIGALQRRLPVPAGCSVRYVDRMRLADLWRHYPELRQFPLQEPDLVDNGEELFTVADNSQDFVVANHFFEHSENPLRTLMNFLRVLRPMGVLFVAVPDKNYTFDLERPLTLYETLKHTYVSSVRPDRRDMYREWVQYIEHVPAGDVEARTDELLSTHYSIHFNVWTVDSLLEFLFRARADFNIPFELVSTVCCDNEAIVILERRSE